MDKNGECLRAWQALGFGFIEIGTVTVHNRATPNHACFGYQPLKP